MLSKKSGMKSTKNTKEFQIYPVEKSYLNYDKRSFKHFSSTLADIIFFILMAGLGEVPQLEVDHACEENEAAEPSA